MMDIDIHVDSVGNKRIGKLKETENGFLELCRENGADIVNYYESLSAKILILPQVEYNEDGLEVINKVKAGQKIVCQGFGYGKLMLDHYHKIGCRKLYVYEKKVFMSVLKKQNRLDLAKKYSVQEMGSPYLKYKVFKEDDLPEIDYLVALPTLLFIKNPSRKRVVLKNIYDMANKLCGKYKIVIKLHNVIDSGIFYVKDVNTKSVLIADIAKYFGKSGNKLSSASYFKKLLSIAEPLSNYTKYYNLNLELFLPSVKRGIITGISTVQWHGLYSKTPVYNCDPQKFSSKLPNFEVYNNFYVKHSKSMLTFNNENYNKISPSSRKADLIEMLKAEINNNGNN